jgi:hypothetical protein
MSLKETVVLELKLLQLKLALTPSTQRLLSQELLLSQVALLRRRWPNFINELFSVLPQLSNLLLKLAVHKHYGLHFGFGLFNLLVC